MPHTKTATRVALAAALLSGSALIPFNAQAGADALANFEVTITIFDVTTTDPDNVILSFLETSGESSTNSGDGSGAQDVSADNDSLDPGDAEVGDTQTLFGEIDAISDIAGHFAGELDAAGLLTAQNDSLTSTLQVIIDWAFTVEVDSNAEFPFKDFGNAETTVEISHDATGIVSDNWVSTSTNNDGFITFSDAGTYTLNVAIDDLETFTSQVNAQAFASSQIPVPSSLFLLMAGGLAIGLGRSAKRPTA